VKLLCASAGRREWAPPTRSCHDGSRDHAGGRQCGSRDCSLGLYGSLTGGGPEAAVSANARSSASYAFDYGSVLSRRIPARSASATDQFAVAAALISEADRSVTLARPYHPMWRPGMHSTATSKITLCRSMRNLQAGRFRRGLEGVASIYHLPPVRDYRVGSSAGCRVGSPATVSSSRTRAITRRVSSVIRAAAARCSAPSAGSMPRSCASASRAASGLFSWCWIRTIAFRTSLRTIAGIVSAGVFFVAASSRISGEDDRIDCSVTTDAARVSTIV